MKRKYNILRLLPMALALAGITVFLIYNENLNDRFIEESVNSTVVKRDNWQLRTTEFYLKNKLRVDSTPILQLDLKVGDSISKKSGTGKFNVYRMNKGRFEYHNSYEIQL